MSEQQIPTVIENELTDNFSMVPNAIWNDARIGYKAKGILCYLLSKPTGWRIQTQDICNRSQDKMDAVLSGLMELRKAGYATLDVVREDGKIKQKVFRISHKPHFDPPKEKGKETLKPENPAKENTSKETPAISNTQSLVKQNISIPETVAQVDSKPLKPKKEPNPSHKLFLKLWTERHLVKFQRKYFVKGAVDGAAVSRLLTNSGETPEALMAIVEMAWNKPLGFNCKQAVSIAGFVSRFNEIRAEIDQATIPAVPKEAPLWKQIQDCEEAVEDAKDAIYYQHDRTPEKEARYYALKAKLDELKARKHNEPPRR